MKNLPAVQNFALPSIAEDPELMELAKENLGGDQITPDMLVRLKVPAGGATTFSYEDVSGEEVSTKTVKGIVLVNQRINAYWESKDVSNEPPNCFSKDGIRGIGDPGGECSECEMNQFQEDGTGKLCSNKVRLVIQMQDSLFPCIFDVPPTSIKNWKQYSFFLLNERRHFSSVLTEISLEKAESKKGVKYAKASFAAKGTLPDDQLETIRKYAQIYRDKPQTFDVTSEDSDSRAE